MRFGIPDEKSPITVEELLREWELASKNGSRETPQGTVRPPYDNEPVIIGTSADKLNDLLSAPRGSFESYYSPSFQGNHQFLHLPDRCLVLVREVRDQPLSDVNIHFRAEEHKDYRPGDSEREILSVIRDIYNIARKNSIPLFLRRSVRKGPITRVEYIPE